MDDLEIDYAVVSDYVALSLGRSRATEDIDIITESFSVETANELAEQTLNNQKLEKYAQDLGVQEEYERLRES